MKSSLIHVSLLTLAAAPLAGCSLEASSDAESTASSIVGGASTSLYPAVGALTEQGEPFCTGTVIAPRVVVTAAHCLEGSRASDLRFAIGPNAFQPSLSLVVSKITLHPAYDTNSLDNDIGVMVLASNAPVTPIAMNTAALDGAWVGRSVTFVGYGVTNGVTEVGGGRKRQVSIPIAEVGATQFAYTSTTKNTCFGDSGGPALWKNAAGTTFVVGVTSYGDETCRRYGVDTRVDAYQAFVTQASSL